MTTTFGAHVRQRRRALDLTQAELADRAGFAAITIRRVESGERRPSKELVAALAQALEVPGHEQEAFAQLGRHLVGQAPAATVTLAGTGLARLQPPPPPPCWVPRPALEHRLEEAARTTLTTVIAAPGFGKTATVAAWAEHRSDTAWLTLSPAQSQLEPLLAGLVDAIRLQVPGMVASAHARVAGPHGAQTARADARAAQLLREVEARLAARSLTLVLDEVEHLAPDGEGRALLEALVRQAPGNLHLILLSRTELPFQVGRLRLTGRLTEIGPPDLRFTGEDVADLLALRLGTQARDLSGAVLAATDGWPTATHLVADSLAVVDEKHWGEAVARLRQPGPELATFLTQEVLATLPPHQSEALTALAALPSFDASLARRLGFTGADALIADLRGRGLIRARTFGETYEVSGLIAGYLAAHATLPRSRRRTVLREGADWLAGRGEGEAALALLTAEADTEALTALLARIAPDLVTAGHTTAVLEAAGIVPAQERPAAVDEAVGQALLMAGRWEESLACMRRAAPAGTSTLPRIARWTGVVHHLRGDLSTAIEIYRSSAGEPDADPDVAVVHALHASAVWVQGDLEQARALAGRALERARASGDPAALAAAHTALAMIAAGDGDRRANDVHDRLALEFAERAGDALQLVRIRSNRGSHLIETAQYGLALEELTAAIDLAEVTGFAPFLALARTNRGEALTALGRHEEAATEYLAAAELYDRIESRLIVYPLLSLAELSLLRGEVAQAAAYAEEVLRRGGPDGPQMIRVRAWAALARLHHPSDRERAREIADRVRGSAAGMVAVEGRLAAGWVALCEGEAPQARELAQQAGDLAQVRRDAAGYAESRELLALSSTDRGEAAGHLDTALAEWERIGDRFRSGLTRLAQHALAGDATGVQSSWTAMRRRGLRDGATRVAGLLGALVQGMAPVLPGGPHGLVEPQVRICLLGSFRLYLGGAEVRSDQLSEAAWALVRALALRRGRPASRTELARSISPDGPGAAPASEALAAAIAETRVLLDQGQGLDEDWYLVDATGSVWLNTDHVDLDADRFLHEGEQVAKLEPGAQALERLAALEASYTGDIATGAEPPGLGEECRAAYLGVLRHLVAGHSERGEHEDTVRYSLRLLTHDPTDEGAALALVASLETSGQYGEARRHYRQYTARMRDLGIEPAPYPATPRPSAPK